MGTNIVSKQIEDLSNRIEVLNIKLDVVTSLTNTVDTVSRALTTIAENQPKPIEWSSYATLFVTLVVVGLLWLIGKCWYDLRKLGHVALRRKYPEHRTRIDTYFRERQSAPWYLNWWRRLKLAMKLPFSEGNTFAYLVHIIGHHPISFLLLTAVLLGLFSWRKYDVVLLAFVGFFITFISAYYASRSDYSAKQAVNASQDSYEKASLAMSSMKQFSDDLGGFIERFKLLLEKIEKDNEAVTIKFVSVIPAFGSVGLGRIVEDQDETYYERMQRVHGDKYEKFHDALKSLLYRYNPNPGMGAVRMKLKMLTHIDDQLTNWVRSILLASRIIEEDGKKLWQAVYKQIQVQLAYLMELRPGEGSTFVKIRRWPEIHGSKSIPFQFVIIKPYVERDDNADPEALSKKQDVGRKLMFITSGDYTYENFLRWIDDVNVKLSMGNFINFTKGYYSEEPGAIDFFDSLFEYFWKNSNDKRVLESGVAELQKKVETELQKF